MQQRVSLFSNKSLKNKHHHLTHYPNLIKQVGPLVLSPVKALITTGYVLCTPPTSKTIPLDSSVFWCMRFEAKHQRNKRILHISGNFKNDLKTCAVRHQQHAAYNIMKQSAAVCSTSDITVGPGSVVTLSELHDGCFLNTCLQNIGMY